MEPTRLPGQDPYLAGLAGTQIAPYRGCGSICPSYTGDVAERRDPLDGCVGFDWDEANAQKNWERHRVTQEEAEDVFFNEPLVVRGDVRHSRREKRYYALGQTDRGRRLFVAFTIRRKLIRTISVRDMSRGEEELYGWHEKTHS